MFASLLGSRKDPRSETTPLLQAIDRYRRRHQHPHAEPSVDDEDREDDDADPHFSRYHDPDEDDEDNDGRGGDGPLLPVFSSEFLDRIPTYNTTHAIRILVIQRCETTLSWDQLRSPQVSQFLVKPIQQTILADHFSRGAIYCLLANCLQFRKEGEANPANVGVNKSRALVCELLAMRLLKEFSTRELIDALSYDFNPLQGLSNPGTGVATPGGNWNLQNSRSASARISSVEIAIRAQAKKFLAHPLVVQQLEAIWAGTIVFHSVADSLHRKPEPQVQHYRTFEENISPGRGPSRRISPTKTPRKQPEPLGAALMRKTVTLYDPHDASLFKLSRLRVPRYRSLFSTLSFGVMLGLFLAVLGEKSDDITPLEVLFWFWSAGYMLDELVGFSEQGFGLYIMSVWNAFDLGILLMFLVYYVLRLYGILMPDVHSRHDMASMAYDVLGSTAVLLFPRLFSALDHYRYFSQLLIAFRMMAMDLVAILVLIVISCSGFFVAFTLAFKKDMNASTTAYALFQLILGFTPAAWDIWADYNPLGKTILALFLFICHFLIVTILITVLTNSFMAVVQNSNEEHQFLFAVNTISMVKSDALFSYIPPTNIIGWLLIPLKYVMPFRKFVRFNRLIVKITHMPVLFSIFLYERMLLANLDYGPTDLVEQRGRSHSKAPMPAFSIRGPIDVFSPGNRLREPSIATFRKDRALEEVFRRPFRDNSIQAPSNLGGRRNSSNVVKDWMKRMGSEDGDAAPPQEDTRSLLERLETRARPGIRRTKTAGHLQLRRNHMFTARTANSDPDENTSPFTRPIAEEEEPALDDADPPQQSDDDGDDELLTNDEDGASDHTPRNRGNLDSETKLRDATYETSEDEFFRTPMTMRPKTPKTPMARTPARAVSPTGTPFVPGSVSPNKRHQRQKPNHNRNWSSNTILFSPSKASRPSSSSSRSRSPGRPPRTSKTHSGAATPGRTLPPITSSDGHKTPKRSSAAMLSASPATRPRPILPPPPSNPNAISHLLSLNQRSRGERSFNAMALDLASDLGDNRQQPDFGALNNLPASFSTQLEMAARDRARLHHHHRSGSSDEESKRMSRIMLARMTTLEEGFRDVLKEVKGLVKGSEGGGASGAGTETPPMLPPGTTTSTEAAARRKGKARKKAGNSGGSGGGGFGGRRAVVEEPRMGSSL
ncbi:hypothetical protein DM02DRAFT_521310 [Periconia macrospinosa]|uniref:Uncharacterized protein n=1 Tax=Periconia macrospinosa TaxID=97972 RepID=A0A2V1DXX4_9PLEO|nr:hypothetical protein DM02DRAFT_521310 [Periconia macrospinosa]